MAEDAAERGDIINYSRDIPYDSFEPWLKERLEWFKDQKFGLFMHWGIYSQWGICESWPLVPGEAWVRSDNQPQWLEHRKNYESFSKAYRNLNKSFNPDLFEPEIWAKLAKAAGMKYVCLTTKHHDGFCMWDTQTTSYKITGKDCPFHKNPRANLAKEDFNVFRKEDMAIWAYFSKSDWHVLYYWSPEFSMEDCGRNPNYDTAKHPEIWENFVQYTHQQIRELLTDYGKIDCLWLDGGQVCPQNKQDIHMDEIAEFGRKLQPDLLIADRTVGGPHENFITPEQCVPDQAIDIPWESCITLGRGFAYNFNDTYKKPYQVLQLLMDVVAKGGNLLLNIAPSPEGRFDNEAIRVLQALGAWMEVNSEAVHGTRPVAPYTEGNIRFTQKGKRIYATFIYEDGRDAQNLRVSLRKLRPAPGAKVGMLGLERAIEWEERGDRAVLFLPKEEERPCRDAWVFYWDC